jgi:hypothetical protein
MAQHQQFVEIDEIINSFIDESEQSIHKFFKLWHIAFRGMTELGLDFFYKVKSLKLPINANFTVNLPADYLQYSKIGVLNDRGEIIPLRYNEKLTYYADQLPDRLEKTQDPTLFDAVSNNSPVWFNYWNGYMYTNLYGLPSGAPFVGSFKIDEQAGIILLDENFIYEYLMVEYVATPQEGEVYRIPIQFKEALISYLRWKDIISIPSKTHVNNSNVQMRRHEFFNDRRIALARFRPYYLEQAYMLNLEMTRKTVKA